MPQKVAFSGPNMFSTVIITTGENYSNRTHLKKRHFLDLICAIYVVAMRMEFFLVKSPLFKKRYFLDLICLVQVVTIITELSYIKRSLLKKFHILDLVCSVQVGTIINCFSYRKRSCLKKVAFSWPSMFTTCSNYYNWVML